MDFEQNRDLTLVWHRVKTVLEELSMVCHHKERVGSFWPPWEVCMDALQHSGPGQSKGDARQMIDDDDDGDVEDHNNDGKDEMMLMM